MNILITLISAGEDTGPFDIYSDSDGYLSAFESGVTKEELTFGYPSPNAPESTTIVKVKSTNSLCNNYVNVSLDAGTGR